MSGMKALGGSAILAALICVPAMPAMAFDAPQQSRNYEDWDEVEQDEVQPDEVQRDDTVPEDDAAPTADAATSEEDAAVDACAVAAEREATIDGYRGRVRGIGQVQQTGGGWEVEGVVETGRGLVGLFRDETLFTCFVRGGRVENVRLDDGTPG